ncbi:MAG: threonylcarbamoyl-AMP synthase [Burkholderiales bacterium]|nr:threonylcarbamoyl-AMP synthase [Burkholderiales bacterium]
MPQTEVSAAQIDRAVAVLNRGGLVAFPTETVYGLGADATNPTAVRKIFSVKGRPHHHPLIVHLADMAQVEQWADPISPTARLLAERFWPGPLTLIMRRAAGVSDAVTGAQDTVGLRIPAHPIARALLRAFGGGIAAPSANRFGRISPTTAKHVRAELGADVDLVLDGGDCDIGIESTIVDVSGARPAMLRPGRITAADLAEVLAAPLAQAQLQSPRAPGMLAGHYAPRTQLRLVSIEHLPAAAARLRATGKRVAVLASVAVPAATYSIAAPVVAIEFARELYANLRCLDDSGCDVILVEAPPDQPEWAAIRDRLTRAAHAEPSVEP